MTFTEEAYERLKSWKDSGRESFSAVVLRVVPKRGTAADLHHAFRDLPVLTEEQKRMLETSLQRSEGGDP